tara:strand:+ start:16770 stop:17522 length:753 start_codon:yes stop_codon:yes gene_type:complete
MQGKCYAKLIGGVGNQLFILAAAYAYSRKYGKELLIDDSRWSAGQGNPPKAYEDNLFRNFKYETSTSNGFINITEKEYNYNKLPNIIGNVCLNGYFQSLKYFEEYKQEFLGLLSMPKVDTSFIEDKNVAFHIRRGDYLLYEGIHHVCDTKYFTDRFKQFEGYQINVFTDSPSYVLKEFDSFDFKLMQTSSELSDISLMSKHSNIVCSNSTFSWWAALLGNMDQVVVPSKWFADGRDASDIYTENMMKIDV